jgi:uncharacterized protein
MKVFVDTSAFFALLDRDDDNHEKAARAWEQLIGKDSILFTTNYVLIECFALIQHRLGMEAVRIFQEDISPVLNIEFVDSATHKTGVSSLLAASRRKLSLVDCISFEVMRLLDIRNAFAFDPHFTEQGIRCIH